MACHILCAIIVCCHGASLRLEAIKPPPLPPRPFGPVKRQDSLPLRVLPDYLLKHLENFSTDIETYPLRFLPRLKEVHIGGESDLMGGGKLYRSGHPVFLPNLGDMIVWSSDKAGSRLRAHERDVRSLRRLYPNIKQIINFNASPFDEDTQGFFEDAEIDIVHMPLDDFVAPTLDQITTAIDLIEHARLNGRDSLIFCGFGDGRSGVITAAYEVFKIQEAYPYLGTDELELFIERRNGMAPLGMSASPTVTFERFYSFVNSVDDHMIENPVQYDALIEYANSISERTECRTLG
eukprot:GEMP01053605.1.p1 GENE.GEMP01053605.1~~GEMP01053605.1.p1  ORF type:complete len:293 (+),score=32.59 GEMP01053605.1:53-931(+)